MNPFKFLTLLLISPTVFAAPEFLCHPEVPDYWKGIQSIATEFTATEANLFLQAEATSGDRKDISTLKIAAERSEEGAVVYYTTDMSVLIINKEEVDPETKQIHAVYIFPQERKQIAMTCDYAEKKLH